MEKKMYYKFDNGDTPVICTLQDVKDMLDAEASDYNEASNEADEPSWISLWFFLPMKNLQTYLKPKI